MNRLALTSALTLWKMVGLNKQSNSLPLCLLVFLHCFFLLQPEKQALIWSNSQFNSQFTVVYENRCAFCGILNRPGRVSLRKAFFNKGFKLAHPHIILIYLLPYLLACLLTYWLIFVLVKLWFVKNLYRHHESIPKFCRDCGLKGTHIKTQTSK